MFGNAVELYQVLTGFVVAIDRRRRERREDVERLEHDAAAPADRVAADRDTPVLGAVFDGEAVEALNVLVPRSIFQRPRQVHVAQPIVARRLIERVLRVADERELIADFVQRDQRGVQVPAGVFVAKHQSQVRTRFVRRRAVDRSLQIVFRERFGVAERPRPRIEIPRERRSGVDRAGAQQRGFQRLHAVSAETL